MWTSTCRHLCLLAKWIHLKECVKERKEGENERRRETWEKKRLTDKQTERKIGRQRKTKRMRK